jgi:urea transport system permease protein
MGWDPDRVPPLALAISMLDFVGNIHLRALLLGIAGCLFFATSTHAAENVWEIISKAVLAEDAAEKVKLVHSLGGQTDGVIPDLLTKWKEGEIYVFEPMDADGNAAGPKSAIFLTGEKDVDEKRTAVDLATNAPLKDKAGNILRLTTDELTSADTDADLRQAMKTITDLFAIADPDPSRRLKAVEQIGLDQNLEKLPALQTQQVRETETKIRRALEQSIALIQLKSEDANAQIAACQKLASLGSIAAQDALKTLTRECASSKPPVATAANEALVAIAQHVKLVNTYGTAFRGLSLGSVLLVVAIGLAITFGLMGVINMAHGELMAVGAYTTYVVQNIFGNGIALSPFGLKINVPGFGATGSAYDAYFIVALPLSFLVAALVGLALERGIIRWLYRRPLESLLATWGVSLVLQQLFRLVFGANNVQVDSPAWLSGNWTVYDVILGWNRVFVIGFAFAIVVGTWLLLTKTPVGLLIRAVTQNRAMAACMGVRTERVNMFTFAFGSGLAGLAGAFLSQIGNVGPSLGQSYIVDSFMTVVVGGVGSIFGTVISAVGIGVADQSLQQLLGNPVLGKILVLGAIILFLQWKPAGLFVTKSRSLES